MQKREIHFKNFNTNSIKNMPYEPVVYHGQQAFLRSYIRIERAKRAMLLERQFKKMVAIRIYAFSIRICVLACILYLIGYDGHIKWYKSRRNYYVNIKRNPFEKILW